MFTTLVAGATSVVVGLVVWWVQSRIEENRRLAERLYKDRADLYIRLLQPMEMILSGQSGNPARVAQALQQKEYRNAAFQIHFFGSDDVLRAFNSMWQFLWSMPLDEGPVDESVMLEAFTAIGQVMLAIRRDMGNKRTRLEPLEMFMSRIKDLPDVIARAQR